MTARIAAVVVAALALPGCPSDDSHTLWLAPDGAETRVKLVESEPHPF